MRLQRVWYSLMLFNDLNHSFNLQNHSSLMKQWPFSLDPTQFSEAQRRSRMFVIFHQRSIMLIKEMGWKEVPIQPRSHARCQSN